ncbi:hypothetical protein GOBAR_AA19761 [Gossypium barbadense]|uniref:Uncharacterized protein n=1 Tax=Gossypium barbadense TaxID=3634 RepID=A0A2P5XC30_GOSBA|nr:hypothetical protein GOBAR_AA19761 [Gossypium barbadense]
MSVDARLANLWRVTTMLTPISPPLHSYFHSHLPQPSRSPTARHMSLANRASPKPHGTFPDLTSPPPDRPYFASLHTPHTSLRVQLPHRPPYSLPTEPAAHPDLIPYSLGLRLRAPAVLVPPRPTHSRTSPQDALTTAASRAHAPPVPRLPPTTTPSAPPVEPPPRRHTPPASPVPGRSAYPPRRPSPMSLESDPQPPPRRPLPVTEAAPCHQPTSSPPPATPPRQLRANPQPLYEGREGLR